MESPAPLRRSLNLAKLMTMIQKFNIEGERNQNRRRDLYLRLAKEYNDSEDEFEYNADTLKKAWSNLKDRARRKHANYEKDMQGYESGLGPRPKPIDPFLTEVLVVTGEFNVPPDVHDQPAHSNPEGEQEHIEEDPESLNLDLDLMVHHEPIKDEARISAHEFPDGLDPGIEENLFLEGQDNMTARQSRTRNVQSDFGQSSSLSSKRPRPRSPSDTISNNLTRNSVPGHRTKFQMDRLRQPYSPYSMAGRNLRNQFTEQESNFRTEEHKLKLEILEEEREAARLNKLAMSERKRREEDRRRHDEILHEIERKKANEIANIELSIAKLRERKERALAQNLAGESNSETPSANPNPNPEDPLSV